MRTEQEMFDLILGVAKADERIRAVLLVGSRANPNAPKDNYQDYDITYFVKNISPFYNNIEWIEKHFGKPSVVQLPELMTHPLLPPENDGHFTYLMLFEDGNRIDLSIEFTPYIDDGEPAIALLDKDGFLPDIPAPTDQHWHIKPPTEKLFSDCCNEFWWCLNNVAKGIARDELPYAMEMFNHYVRDMLNQMVEWTIGIQTDYSVSVGKMGKYFKKYLPSELYDMYRKTYSDSDYEHIWTAIFTACKLFRMIALNVSKRFEYVYNHKEDDNMMAYLNKVKSCLFYYARMPEMQKPTSDLVVDGTKTPEEITDEILVYFDTLNHSSDRIDGSYIKIATETDLQRILDIDPFRRTDSISHAVKRGDCYIAVHDGIIKGFAIMNYTFFDNGFIELLIVAENYRKCDIGTALLNHLFTECETEKLFTSTNQSNVPMKKLLAKTGFIFCGQIEALDEGDPELFYVRKKAAK